MASYLSFMSMQNLCYRYLRLYHSATRQMPNHMIYWIMDNGFIMSVNLFESQSWYYVKLILNQKGSQKLFSLLLWISPNAMKIQLLNQLFKRVIGVIYNWTYMVRNIASGFIYLMIINPFQLIVVSCFRKYYWSDFPFESILLKVSSIHTKDIPCRFI